MVVPENFPILLHAVCTEPSRPAISPQYPQGYRAWNLHRAKKELPEALLTCSWHRSVPHTVGQFPISELLFFRGL